MKSKKGFTLVEMMLVVAIVVILSAVGVIAIGDTIKKTKNQQAEYQQHIDSMGYAQGNVKNIMANTRDPNVPTGSAKPADPIGDLGGDKDKTPAEGDKTPVEEDKTPAEDKTEDGKDAGSIGGTTDKKTEEDTKVEPEKKPDENPADEIKPGSVTPAAGTTTSTVNYWSKRDGYSDGFFKITTEKSVSEMTIIVPNGVTIKNLDWRYKQEKNSDGTVTITYTADKYQTRIKEFDLQFEANMKEIPAGTFVVVSYK